ncbi:MAG: hypothetical protein Q8O89_05065 [Nanoarchaeota archaeon]|nr:hypothetical protein [Nanoarchaeota archaeon]
MMIQERIRKRNDSRTFSCSDELWEEMLKATRGLTSVSSFIRIAVDEKLRKDGLRK